MKRSCTTHSKEYWEETAAGYDEDVFVVWKECATTVPEDALTFASENFDADGDECCVDFGTGCGKALPFLADHFTRVVGLDHSPKLIRAAAAFCDDQLGGCSSEKKKKKTTKKKVEAAPRMPMVAVSDLSTGKSVRGLVNSTVRASSASNIAKYIRITRGVCCNVLLSPSLDTRQAILATIHASMEKGGILLCIAPSLESKLFMESLLRRWDSEEASESGIASLPCKPYSLSSSVESQTPRGGQRGRRARRLVLNDVLNGVLPAGGTPTCHYLAAQLESELGEAGFRLVGDVKKVSYNLSTEFLCDTPAWMRKSHVSKPWDWLAIAQKV